MRLQSVFLALLLAGCGGGYNGYKAAPYTVRGQHYCPIAPRDAVGYTEIGTASHYREGFFIFPGKTAIGEHLFPWTKSAAHKTLPLPCRVRVTNLENGRRIVLRVNDRGPFVGDRAIDLTTAAADALGFREKGLTTVKIEVLSVGDGRYRIR